MTNYAAHLQATGSISRPATGHRTPVRRLMIVATAIVLEGIVILAVVLSTVERAGRHLNRGLAER